MEFWWWIEPLFLTGLVCLFLDCLLVYAALDSDSKVLEAIAIALFVPFAIWVLSIITWGLCYVFWIIWEPYF